MSTEENGGSLTTVDRPPTELVVRAATDAEPIMSIGSNIAGALAKARDRCANVEKDARNSFQKFNYASADAIISAAKDAMTETGLIVIPLPPELHVCGSGTLAFYEMRRRIVLAHSSGEAIELPISHWPVIPDKGRPLDKAFAIALTTSLAYFLRDLLSMPRVDATDDMTGRNESAGSSSRPAANVSNSGLKASPERVNRINLLIGQLGWKDSAVNERLLVKYGVGDVGDLSPEQADEVEQAFETVFRQKQQPASAAC